MITFLTVEKAMRKFPPFGNRISADVKTSGGLSVKHIKCLCRGKKVPWNRIGNMSGNEADRLLISEDVELPRDGVVRRFASDELKSRLCLNMATELLKLLAESGTQVKVAVYDPEARIVDGVGVLLRFTDKLTVVTKMTDIYSAEAQRLMEECGAVLNVSRRMKALTEAKLIVAPLMLKSLLPSTADGLILTSCRPAVSQRSAVYYKYYFDLGEQLKSLIPQGFDAQYFASALYTLCSRFELGSIIPQAAKGDGCDHTVVSMSKYLMNIGSNT